VIPLRCGRISYTNDLPLFAAFDEGVLDYPGTLHSDVPTRLNTMLVSGELDLGPISALAFAKHADRLTPVGDLCIGAHDEVLSVILVSRTPPTALGGAPIAVTDESASGAGLLRVLLERRYGVFAQYQRSADPLARARAGEPALLIGDHAIDARFTFARENIYDLGRLWREWTGEQTVFAVWAARKDIALERAEEVDACVRAMMAARAWGRSHLGRVAALAQHVSPRPAGFYESYYAALTFTLDPDAQRGLSRYWRELVAIGEIDRVPELALETSGVAS